MVFFHKGVKMKNELIFLMIFFITLSSCKTTSNSIVAPSIDMSKYEFASIGSDVTGGSAIMGALMDLQNSLISCGYKIVGDTRINSTLGREDLPKLFIVTMGLTSSSEQSICTINLTDYFTGYIIASFRGSFSWGWDRADNDKKAISEAINKMEKAIMKN
jgi:hypothetical protein